MQTIDADIPSAFAELFEHHRYKVFYGGRGGAKSWNFARALILLAYQRRIRVLCAREVQNSIRESVHKLLSEQIDILGLSSAFEITDRAIRGTNGSEFIFEGLYRNVDKIKSMEAIDVCWVEEAHAVTEESWRILIPTIRKPGSEIWISFNPRLKTDSTYQRFVLHPPADAVVRKVSWKDNPWFPPELQAEREHDFQVDEDMAQHVWEGELKEFADGAIYGSELKRAKRQGRVTDVPIVPTLEVNTFWDLGRNDATAIWFHQRNGFENRFVHCYAHNLVGLDHYIQYLHEWGRDNDAIWGSHYLPHDVEVKELSTNKSRREILEAGGIKPIIVVERTQSLNEGIEQTRRAFHSCWFDREGCENGLDALANYQYVFNEQTASFNMVPQHNWASHYADAFRQFGQGYNVSGGWAAVMDHTDRNGNPYSDRRAAKIKPRFVTDNSWRI